MTPKEKAMELVDKYQSVNIEYSCGGDNDEWPDDIFADMNMSLEEAKQCALIAVDEILKELESIDDGQTTIPYGYWQEVKQEIEAL